LQSVSRRKVHRLDDIGLGGTLAIGLVVKIDPKVVKTHAFGVTS